MLSNRFKYGLVDLSYLLSRNLFACSRGKKIGEFTPGDVVKMTIQTLNKISRDYGITVDKFIFLNDTWSSNYEGYIRTYILHGDYKTSRKWMTQEKLDELKENPETTKEEIEKAEFDLYLNSVKVDAKKILKTELGNFGIPSIGVEGWEFDDLGYLAGAILYNQEDTKHSVIITKDSDLQYALTPKLDYFRIPTAGSSPDVITYSDMWYTIPESIRNKGISLYDYKSYMDSLGFGHNDMKKTRKSKVGLEDTILKILDGDYSNIKYLDTYEKQMSTFKIENFPNFQEAYSKLINDLGVIGKLGEYSEFKCFCDTYGIDISERYFTTFIGRLDKKLYS